MRRNSARQPKSASLPCPGTNKRLDAALRISVLAFYGRNKTLLAFIATLFVAEVTAQAVIIAIAVPSIEIIPSPLPSSLDASACLALDMPSLLPSYWYGQTLWNISINSRCTT